MKIAPDLEPLLVPIDSLRPYPGNPRKGNLSAISASLERHGQFRPIVVNRRNRTILAGNHTWRAARKMGWAQIAASFVDVDDEAAARIVLADNRTSDLSTYDDDALSALIAELDGETPSPVAPQGPEPRGPVPVSPENDPPEALPEQRITVGTWVVPVAGEQFVEWSKWTAGLPRKQVVTELRVRLDLLAEPPTRPKVEKAPPKKRRIPSESPMRAAFESTPVPLDSLRQHPRNPRVGDLGAIAESLVVNGQFRPIVANRRTNEILAGNHTWLAAKALGWSTIGVVWVDVDEEEAGRILLADNATSDAAGYDDDALRELLQSVTSLDGTGWMPEDLGAMVAKLDAPPPPPPDVAVAIGAWRFATTVDCYTAWEAAGLAAVGEDGMPAHIVGLLGI